MQQPRKDAVRAWIALMRVAPALLERIEAELSAAGFPGLDWYDVLWELEQAEDGLRPRDLGQRLLVARYNLSRLIDRLEAEKLVSREAAADDKRGHILHVTRTGKALRQKMWPIYAAALRALVEEKLSVAEAETLAKLLDKLR